MSSLRDRKNGRKILTKSFPIWQARQQPATATSSNLNIAYLAVSETAGIVMIITVKPELKLTFILAAHFLAITAAFN